MYGAVGGGDQSNDSVMDDNGSDRESIISTDSDRMDISDINNSMATASGDDTRSDIGFDDSEAGGDEVSERRTR